jgi:ribosome-associated protein
MMEFRLTESYIELIRLLKYLRVAESGGHAKQLVDEGLVKLNGIVEYRRRAKIRSGDRIEVGEETISVE